MAKGRQRGGAGGWLRWMGAHTWAFIRWLGWRRAFVSGFLFCAFVAGYYLASLYADISILIEQRRAALTSAIYSAPLTIEPGDEITPLHLIDRLSALSYARVLNPAHPGEYSMAPGVMTLYVREF